jgi:acetyl-CoA carboxylase biotin carboxyl carrier protein
VLRVMVRDDVICSTTVGIFVPTLVPGTPLHAGLTFGRLLRLGRWYDLHIPPGTDGYADQPLGRYSPVEYGTALMRIRRRTGRKRAKVKAAVKSMIHSGRTVRAELDGTLYHRPAPDAQPFATEGGRVSAHDTIAVVEVMKTFTRIRAPFSGVLERWLVRDGGNVYQGMPLAVIRPDENSADPAPGHARAV